MGEPRLPAVLRPEDHAVSDGKAVQIVADNKRKLETKSSTFEPDLNFSATAAQNIGDVQLKREY